MSKAVYCLADTRDTAVRIAERLRDAHFPPAGISLLTADREGLHELNHENATKSPEGATVGVGAGALLGGTLGWMVGIGALAIPGLGPFVAAGPILAALSGAAVGGAAGGITGALVGMGVPEYEAKLYEDSLSDGRTLIAVHVADSEEAERVRDIFEEEGGDAISTGEAATLTQ